LRSDYLTTGPCCREFEEKLAQRAGTKYAVVFSSGTAALHAAYFAAGLKPGEEVITTPITFAATANAALYLGGKPVFVDIAPESFHIDIFKIEAAITSKTRIIAPVDMAGIPVDIDPIMQLAEKYNLLVVEDAAHALGASYKTRPVGSTAHLTVFSFHPVKHITTGEGGAVVTNDPRLYDRLVMFRSHGITRDPQKLIDKTVGPWHQEMQLLGYNYRLTDIQCALGESQLKKLDRFLSRRSEIVELYNNAFRDNPVVKIPPTVPFTRPAWHLYIIRLQKGLDKRKAVSYLNSRGVGCQVHYIPVYRHPYYQKLGCNPANYPFAEQFYRQCLSIPLYPALTDQQIQTVIDSVNELPSLWQANAL
jgi:UDP-4-amino-4,6-dideoxy-N-acetyl-beta-L-altrosamine transaminase